MGTNQILLIAENVKQPTDAISIYAQRHILEGVVILHGTLHGLHRKKMDDVVFIDFEKNI
jgi:hypothetical protein